MKPKLIRTATIALSLDVLLKGQLAFLSKYFEVVSVSGDDEHLRTVSKRENIRVIPLTFQRRISIFRDIISIIKLYKIFKKEKPVIVHSITPKAGLLSMTAAYFARVPIRMHTFTGLIFPSKKGFFQWILINMDRLLCRMATNIYPEGEGVKNDLITFKITDKSLKILANGNVNGVNMSYFNASLYTAEFKSNLRRELGLNNDDFVFIYVGRLVTDKGLNELINAFVKINSQFSNCKLLLVGPYESEMDPLSPITLKEIQTNKDIITLGYKTDVRPYFAIANVLTFPSYREGFPNVVLQAGAMGLPCIVTDINGSNEIIQHNVNGLIVLPKNDIELANAMIKLFEEDDLRAKLQSNARLYIENRYKQEIVWQSLLNEYNSLYEALKVN